jgi:hypothetical protein
MTIVLSIAMKIIWWALPKLAGSAIDKLGINMLYVEQANTLLEPAARRKSVINSIGTSLDPLPESFIRAYVELLVILNRVGVTSQSLEAMETLVQGLDAEAIANPDKRLAALQVFSETYKDIPESVARFLVELAVAKARSAVSGA